MSSFKENFNLKEYNTFGISARAKYFISINDEQDLLWLILESVYQNNQVLWLGGGSNMLLTQDFDGLVVHLNFLGKYIEDVDENKARLIAKAGENWHQLVLFALDNNLGGIENLSYIPGNAGTAPIQNIGAYGVEIQDRFEQLRAFDLKEQKFVTLSHEECQFGYRDSLFKRAGKNRYIVTEIHMLLSRNEHHLNLEYGAIRHELEKLDKPPGIHAISEAVINIRKSKLPNPKEIGNSGSFFKNPVVSQAQFRELEIAYPNIASFRLGDNQVKLAAGWLIEQAGWKGYRKGDAGVHNKQALVLVNYGKAKGTEIAALAKRIQDSVFVKFAVELEPEVNII